MVSFLKTQVFAVCLLCVSASSSDALVQPSSTIQSQRRALICIGRRQTRLHSAKRNSVDKNETNFSNETHEVDDNSNEGNSRNFNKKKASKNHFGNFGGMFQNMFSSQYESTTRKGKFGLPAPEAYQHINEFDIDLANEIDDALAGLNFDYDVFEHDSLRDSGTTSRDGGTTSSEVFFDDTSLPEGVPKCFPSESTLERSRKLYFADDDEPSWKVMDLSKSSQMEFTQPEETIVVGVEYNDVVSVLESNVDFGESDEDKHMQDRVDLAIDRNALGLEVGMIDRRKKITSVAGDENKFGRSSIIGAVDGYCKPHDALSGVDDEKGGHNDGDRIIPSNFLENRHRSESGDNDSRIGKNRNSETFDNNSRDHDTKIIRKSGDDPNDATSGNFVRYKSTMIDRDDEYTTDEYNYDSNASERKARGICNEHFDSNSKANALGNQFITPEALEFALSLDLDIYDIYQDKMHYTMASIDDIFHGQSEDGVIDEQDVQRYYDRLNDLLLFTSFSSGTSADKQASDKSFTSQKDRNSDSSMCENDNKRSGNDIYNLAEEQKNRPQRKESLRMESFRALRERDSESKFRRFSGDNRSNTIFEDVQEMPRRQRLFHDATILPNNDVNKFRKIDDFNPPHQTQPRTDFQRGIYNNARLDPNIIKPLEKFAHSIENIATTRISQPPVQGVDYSSHNSSSSLSQLASTHQEKRFDKFPHRIPSRPYASEPFHQMSQESFRRPYQEEEDDQSLGVYGRLSALPHEYRAAKYYNERNLDHSLQPQGRMNPKGIETDSEPGVYGQLSSLSQSRSNQRMYDGPAYHVASIGFFSTVPGQLPNFSRFPPKNTFNTPIPDNSQAYCTEDALSFAERFRIRLSDVPPSNPDLPITARDVERHLQKLEGIHQQPPPFQSMSREKIMGGIDPFPPFPSAPLFEQGDMHPSNRLADNTDDDVFPSFFSAAFQPQGPGESANEAASNNKNKLMSEVTTSQNHDTDVFPSFFSPSFDSIRGDTTRRDLGTKLDESEVGQTQTSNSKISHTTHKSDGTLLEDPKFYGIWND